MKVLYALIITLFSACAISLQTSGQTPKEGETLPYQSWQFLYENKCSKCHTLERVFSEPKSEDEWRDCINRMMKKSPLWITPDEGEQILSEILGKKEGVVASFPERKRYDDARLLFIDRCTICHPVNRIITANKTNEEWEETVKRMYDNAPDLFLDGDLPVITEYLNERATILREDVAAEIMVKKCLICHEAGRILLERKSKKDWEKTVTDMRKLAREGFKKDWFNHSEFKIIVNMLVETQGIETEKN
ncbi:MAG: hypothetical protein D8M57_05440 [Candidatus Scalindua sp. AMX11]|nr:MAG: hypothetical protein DWQ00_07345 [Candidatus Scalindua sp.]NOG85943.1 hypothetical protein [Planctomycetota bacterium]RZV91424.1 MAG: hypothetical protein EX341_05705 [Candidatus Scalindua sp. SCAELEC01]TDE65983.1 MAG: hypothetical protein D8M57_05440 [Candidatus Scalindua sp. AMX11]GJQ59291.1 MAG: hypothetical protein SCALA701_20920 [Candidatus Scalindua sp.]